MRPEHRYFDVYPIIVPTDGETVVSVRPRVADRDWAFTEDCRIRLVPVEGGTRDNQGDPAVTITGRPGADGVLRVRLPFGHEQEYVLSVTSPGTDNGRAIDAQFRLYALEPDLLARRPYKGDLHIHSSRSDGLEPPPYVVAAGRRAGLDFIAVTDHRQYAPSLEAQRAFQGLPIDLRIFPGEEVHPPGNPVHIVNFGGRESVNECFASEAYRAEVDGIAARLTDLPDGPLRSSCASCMWCFERIRAVGGLGLFCHPYWIYPECYNVPGALTDLLLERQPFDALELLGGYRRHEVESNILQVARYHDERARGRRIPIVGVSDAHGCESGELLGWYMTVAFSPSLVLSDLIASVKDLYSVAIEALPGETPRAYGPLRLVKYTQFLLREVFPLHDELCAEEGREMLAFLAGEDHALAAMQGRTARLYQRLWAGLSGD